MLRIIFPKRWDCPVILRVTAFGIKEEQISLLFGEPPLQEYPNYILQSYEHPSPLLLLPSSHSKVYLNPSPHF